MQVRVMLCCCGDNNYFVPRSCPLLGPFPQSRIRRLLSFPSMPPEHRFQYICIAADLRSFFVVRARVAQHQLHVRLERRPVGIRPRLHTLPNLAQADGFGDCKWIMTSSTALSIIIERLSRHESLSMISHVQNVFAVKFLTEYKVVRQLNAVW